jgi:hypothetical protein
MENLNLNGVAVRPEIRPETPKDELIAKLCNKSLRLSYSSLKQFTTPLNFINYKLNPPKPNEGMQFGSLCDLLILSPEEVENKVRIVEKVPTTDMQANFCNELIVIAKDQPLNDTVIETVFKNHYKSGSAAKTYESLEKYIDASVKGFKMVTKEVYNQAKEVSDNLLNSPEAEPWLSQISETQKRVQWEENGWDFLGFYDAMLQQNIGELKYTSDANPEKFERDIQKLDYYLQAGMYCYSAEKLGLAVSPRFYTLIYDKKFNVALLELDPSYINYGYRKYKFLLQELERCIALNAWDQSYGFFKQVYTVSKPKWIKAIELKEEASYDL